MKVMLPMRIVGHSITLRPTALRTIVIEKSVGAEVVETMEMSYGEMAQLFDAMDTEGLVDHKRTDECHCGTPLYCLSCDEADILDHVEVEMVIR